MKKLFTTPPNRLFTFGCSFTGYVYDTWAEILAYELKIPLYNYGRVGAGNQYIFNSLMQSINRDNINSDDLVMVSWTNTCREDRRLEYGWDTPGNVYTSHYDKNYINKYVWPTGMATRDFATFDASRRILQNLTANFHFLTMCDLDVSCEWGTIKEKTQIDQLSVLYKETVDLINASFYKILWNNDIQTAIAKKQNLFKYPDSHPYPIEHLTYLTKIFPNYQFSENTKKEALVSTKRFTDLCLKYKKPFYESDEFRKELTNSPKMVINCASDIL